MENSHRVYVYLLYSFTQNKESNKTEKTDVKKCINLDSTEKNAKENRKREKNNPNILYWITLHVRITITIATIKTPKTTITKHNKRVSSRQNWKWFPRYSYSYIGYYIRWADSKLGLRLSIRALSIREKDLIILPQPYSHHRIANVTSTRKNNKMTYKV